MGKYIFPMVVIMAGLLGSVGWADKYRINAKPADKIIMSGKIIMKNMNEYRTGMLVAYKGRLYYCVALSSRTSCWVNK